MIFISCPLDFNMNSVTEFPFSTITNKIFNYTVQGAAYESEMLHEFSKLSEQTKIIMICISKFSRVRISFPCNFIEQLTISYLIAVA